METRILIITRNAWNNGNNGGNTLTNFFSKFEKGNLANLFCRAEVPDNQICDKYYRITESDLIANIVKGREVGTVAAYEDLTRNGDKIKWREVENEKKLYDFFRNYRLYLLLWGKELLWAFGKWKNQKLDNFLKEFNPQIIYIPIYNSFYMHDLLYYVKSVTNVKVVLQVSDDVYSLKQFSLSLFYWINRLLLRSKIRRSIELADICYCMSDTQISELEKEFGNKFKILRKGMNISEERSISVECIGVIDFVYIGNILSGRWKTLAAIGRAIQEINVDNVRVRLYIYSANRLTGRMQKALNLNDAVIFMGMVAPSKVQEIQAKADVLVHVESFELKYKLQTRLSFSTKLVDYFQNRKCILAVGWEQANSIDYLIKNDAAIVATDVNMLKSKIRQLIDNRALIGEYADKAWACGEKNHMAKKIQNEFYQDLSQLGTTDLTIYVELES
jgi:hypothetical protein